MMSSTPAKSPSDKQATTKTTTAVEAKREVKAAPVPEATSSWTWAIWPFSSTPAKTPEPVKHKIDPAELEAVKEGLNKIKIREIEQAGKRKLQSQREQTDALLNAQKEGLKKTDYIKKIEQAHNKQIQDKRDRTHAFIKAQNATLKQIKYKAGQMKSQSKTAKSIIGHLKSETQSLKFKLEEARRSEAALLEREAKRIETAEAEKAKAEAAKAEASQSWTSSLFGSSTPAAAPAPAAQDESPVIVPPMRRQSQS